MSASQKSMLSDSSKSSWVEGLHKSKYDAAEMWINKITGFVLESKEYLQEDEIVQFDRIHKQYNEAVAIYNQLSTAKQASLGQFLKHRTELDQLIRRMKRLMKQYEKFRTDRGVINRGSESKSDTLEQQAVKRAMRELAKDAPDLGSDDEDMVSIGTRTYSDIGTRGPGSVRFSEHVQFQKASSENLATVALPVAGVDHMYGITQLGDDDDDDDDDALRKRYSCHGCSSTYTVNTI